MTSVPCGKGKAVRAGVVRTLPLQKNCRRTGCDRPRKSSQRSADVLPMVPAFRRGFILMTFRAGADGKRERDENNHGHEK